MDEYFDEFLNEGGFAPAFDGLPVNEEVLEFYQDKLPPRLLIYWREYGFAGFGEGIIWLTNPMDYQNIIDTWLRQTTIWGRENFYTVARTAFGKLYVWGDESDDVTIINPHLNNIIPGDFNPTPATAEEQDRSIGVFFMMRNRESFECYDHNEKKLFKKCLKKLGTVERNEMYSFVPALALGGAATLKNIKKVKILEQLAILSELDEPLLLKSVSEMFGPI